MSKETQEEYDPTLVEIFDKAIEHNIGMEEAKRVMLASHRVAMRVAQKKEQDDG